MKRFLGVTILFLILNGCTVNHELKPPALKPADVPALTLSEPIRWNNSQTSQEAIIITDSIDKYNINLQKYTEVVISALKAEFDRKGYPYSDLADRVISVSVVDVSMTNFMGGVVCNFDLAIKLGDGMVIGIQGSAKSMVREKAINYAAADAVRKILNHSDIIRYLEGR